MNDCRGFDDTHDNSRSIGMGGSTYVHTTKVRRSGLDEVKRAFAQGGLDLDFFWFQARQIRLAAVRGSFTTPSHRSMNRP